MPERRKQPVYPGREKLCRAMVLLDRDEGNRCEVESLIAEADLETTTFMEWLGDRLMSLSRCAQSQAVANDLEEIARSIVEDGR